MTTRKPQQMCVVRIGYQDLVLPMKDGLRLVELLQNAAFGHKRYESGGDSFEVDADQKTIELQMIQANRIRMAKTATPAHLRNAITHEPKLIGKVK